MGHAVIHRDGLGEWSRCDGGLSRFPAMRPLENGSAQGGLWGAREDVAGYVAQTTRRAIAPMEKADETVETPR